MNRSGMSSLILACAAACVAAPPALAGDGQAGEGQAGGPARHATARLIAGNPEVAPGAELELGLVLSVAKGWHIYWRNPGESGAAPELKLTWPTGLEQTGPLRWPAPERLEIPGGLINHVYQGEVTLLVPVKVAADAPAGPLELSGTASWLVCDEDVCVGEEGRVSLTLRVSAQPGPASPEETARLERARSTLPRAPREGELQATWEGTALTLRVPGASELTFFPALPEGELPLDMIAGTHHEGPALTVRYGQGVRGKPLAGHLRARVDAAVRDLWVEIPGPEAAAR